MNTSKIRAVGFAIAVVLLPLWAAVGRAAQRPASGPAAFTSHDRYHQLLEFNRRTLVEPYRAVGNRDPRWDAKAEEYLESMARHLASGGMPPVYWPADVMTRARLIPPGQAVIAAGCDDPLVLYCHAIMLHDTNQPAAALPVLRRAVAGLRNPKYPAYRLAVSAARLARLSTDPAESGPLMGLARERGTSLCCGKLGDADRRLVLQVVWGYFPTRDLQRRFVGDLGRRPDADPWVRDVAAGRLHTKLAWDSRGMGFAHTVTPDGWQGFRANLALASDALARASALAPHLPEAATDMIAVAMGGDDLGEDPADWFGRALAAQVDHLPAYEAMLGGPLLPRWGGSYEEMLELGQACLVKPRYDTLVPWQYVYAVKRIGDDAGRPWALLGRPDVYDTVARVTDGYAEALGKGKGDYYKTARAAAAWRAGKPGEARTALDELTAAGGTPQPEAFAFFGADDGAVGVSHVYAVTGPHAGAVNGAAAKAESGDAKGGLADLQAVLAGLPADDPARRHVQARADALGADVRFAAGEWSPVRVPPSLRGWEVREGTWAAAPDGAVTARFPAAGKTTPAAMLLWQAEAAGRDLGPAFEVAGDISFFGAADERVGLGGGLVVKHRDTNRRAFVLLDQQNQRAGFGTSRGWAMRATAVRDASAFRVRVDGHTLTLFVDDKQVGDPLVLTDDYHGPLEVGLGGVGDGDGVGFRVTNLRVRRLPAGQP